MRAERARSAAFPAPGSTTAQNDLAPRLGGLARTCQRALGVRERVDAPRPIRRPSTAPRSSAATSSPRDLRAVPWAALGDSGRGSGERSNHSRQSTPGCRSIREWCVLVISAKRVSPGPRSAHIAHSGLSVTVARRSSPSARIAAPPARALRAVWRMWYSRFAAGGVRPHTGAPAVQGGGGRDCAAVAWDPVQGRG